MKIRHRAFDCLNKPRYNILLALRDVLLEVRELCQATGLSWHNCYYHLEILQEKKLVEKIASKKENLSRKTYRKERPVNRFKLTQLGSEALEYFPNSKLGGKYL
ncbi:MAG: ArsR family transcriptional regulator [Candidatus Diapherotrites archaeon]